MFNNFYQVSARWMNIFKLQAIVEDNDIEGEVERQTCNIF